jgi:hypothetical protein
MSFAGVTELAYPTMLQVARAIEVHPGIVERLFDITTVSSLVEDVINQMIRLVNTDSVDSLNQSLADTEFLLGGFSWQLGRFKLWRYSWNGNRFARHGCLPSRSLGSGRVCRFIGGPRTQAVGALGRLLAEGNRPQGELGMEPFEILQLFIADPEFDDVGGAPQMVKTYRHLNSEPVTVLWPATDSGEATFAGRPLLQYEKSFTPVFDPRHPDAQSARLRAEESALSADGS